MVHFLFSLSFWLHGDIYCCGKLSMCGLFLTNAWKDRRNGDIYIYLKQLCTS
jgi:hypothetical protein